MPDRRLVVLQPSYLPWLGAFDQLSKADVFVFYDDVQFDKHGWRNRNRIRVPTEQGWAWITIPVRLESHFPRLLDVRVDSRVPWRRKHRRAIEMAYARAAHADLLDTFFAPLFDSDEDRLVEIAIASTRALMRPLGLATELHRSSQLGIEGDRNSRLLRICSHFGATHYLSGPAAQAYLDVAAFEDAGIAVEWHSYDHPVYRQAHEPFISHLSAIDAVLNVGSDAAAFVAPALSAQ